MTKHCINGVNQRVYLYHSGLLDWCWVETGRGGHPDHGHLLICFIYCR